MPAKPGSNAAQLKADLKSGQIGKLYLIHGAESYLKEYYLNELIAATVDDTFREFNLQILEGKALTPESLNEAVESYPAMAERKMVLVRDYDLSKPVAAFQEFLPALLADLPDYVCLVFYFDILEFKIDKRMKLHAWLQKNACIAEFAPLPERELIDWVRRRAKALGKGIDDETCSYLIFLCGNSMINLITEIEKAAAYSVTDAITRLHIDAVCTRVLDAAIFDLTDALAEQRYEKSIALLEDLIAQKNDEIQIFSSIIRHLQRLYAAKVAELNRMGEKSFMELIGTHSPYYAQKLSSTARKLSLPFLRKAVLLASETDAMLKSSGGDAQKTIELALLRMASNFGENT